MLQAFLLAEGCDPEYTEFEIPEILYAREEGDDGAIIILKVVWSAKDIFSNSKSLSHLSAPFFMLGISLTLTNNNFTHFF